MHLFDGDRPVCVFTQPHLSRVNKSDLSNGKTSPNAPLSISLESWISFGEMLQTRSKSSSCASVSLRSCSCSSVLACLEVRTITCLTMKCTDRQLMGSSSILSNDEDKDQDYKTAAKYTQKAITKCVSLTSSPFVPKRTTASN